MTAVGGDARAPLLTERLLLRPLRVDDAGALVEWLFTARGCVSIFAGVYEPNLPSQRLLEGLGFRKDRYFTVSGGTAGKQLPSWRYRLDRA